MTSRILKQFVAALIIFAIFVSTALAWPRKQGQKVQVRFLATSTLIRGTWAQDEDTYLAQLEFRRNDERALVRLVDAYPNGALPLSSATLTSDAGTLLRILRDPQCDRPFGKILLRTALSDPMAILPEPFSYRPNMNSTPSPEAILPSY